MTRNGTAYRLPTLAPLTEGIASGLWPTPNARDGKDLSRGRGFLAARSRHSPSMVTTLLEAGAHWSHVLPIVEAAMGYPSQWIEGTCTASEMPSSLKSPNSSAEQS
jgi:hypothetical protein